MNRHGALVAAVAGRAARLSVSDHADDTEHMRLRNDVIWREAEGEVIALDGGARNYVSANATGALLWKALVDGASRAELVALLVTTYEIDAEMAARDVDDFVAALEASDLLES